MKPAVDSQFISPQGQWTLERYPTEQHSSLRAWDAADELILQHLDEHKQSLPCSPQIWIFNDSFGALSIALHQWHPALISDSYLSHQGCRINVASNNIDINCIKYTNSLTLPDGQPDLVLLKIPKTLALLEDQLHRLKPRLKTETQIIAAGMVKYLRRSYFELFEQIIGPTQTSLAKKKARLVFCQHDQEIKAQPSPYPSYYRLENSSYRITNHANSFAREKLDIGTRLFLEHIPKNPAFKDIIDLGCGNGIVGLIAAERNPTAAIHFVDESYMAVASAKATFNDAYASGGEPGQADDPITSPNASFTVGNSLDGFQPESADLVLNNPPFHQQQTIGDHIARMMFTQSHRVLRQRGELWVIGNRHLGYHVRLKQIFGNCENIASNAKFVVLKATKQ